MTFYDQEPGNVFHSGLAVYNAEDGTLAWDYLSATRQGRNADLRVPAVVDLDLDGTMEILIHNNVVSHEGTLELELPWEPRADKVGHLVVAVANLDDDAFPEIIARDEDNHYVFEHDGTVKWKQPRRNEAEGQITAADFDGDDEIEFVYLACGDVRFGRCAPYFLEMFDTDGSTLWSHQGQARYEVGTGHRGKQNVTAFDANRDGALDVVWWNHVAERLFIFDGRDGSELDSVAAESFNGDQGFVSIADVDDDGHAELIVGATSALSGATQVWEGSAANPLPSAPPYRNQWLFNEAMVQPDLAIPTNPVPHWLRPGLNGWFLLKPEPDPLIGTQQTFTYHANDGALDSNVATVTLDILPAGGPPRFLTDPDALTTPRLPVRPTRRSWSIRTWATSLRSTSLPGLPA